MKKIFAVALLLLSLASAAVADGGGKIPPLRKGPGRPPLATLSR